MTNVNENMLHCVAPVADRSSSSQLMIPAVTEIQSMFSLARHVAISRGAQSTLLIDESAGAMTIQSGSEIVRTREVGAAHRVTLSTNRNSITYSPIGVGYGAANFSLVVSRGAVADTIVVSRLGRVRH